MSCPAARYDSLADLRAVRKNLKQGHILTQEVHCGECGGFHPRLDVRAMHLTPRAIEICRMVALGHTKQEIAKYLQISYWTVHTHVEKLVTGLGALNSPNLVAVAIALDLFDAREFVPTFMERNQNGSTQPSDLYRGHGQREGENSIRDGDGGDREAPSIAGEGP